MSKRPIVKGKGHRPPGDLIALGKSDVRSSGSSKKAHGSERKREAPTPPLGASLAAKKTKHSSGPGLVFTPLGRTNEAERRGSPALQAMQPYEEMAVDVEPNEMLTSILAADEAGDDDRLVGLLCGLVKYLKMNRAKPEPTVYLTLMYLAKAKAQMFDDDVVLEAFCSLLKRDVTINFKSKGNALVSVLVCNALMAAFLSEDDWPDTFLKAYIDDSLGERVWVDRDDCKPFVDNIQRVFGTQHPPKSRADAGKLCDVSSASPSHSGDEDDRSQDVGEVKSDQLGDLNIPVQSRYNYQLTSVESYVVETVKDQLARRQTLDSGCRNLIKLLAAAAGYSEVRALATPRLEVWLQNTKLSRQAQDLLHAVCLNCSQNSASDLEVIAGLIKLRLKTKPLITHFTLCIRDLLNQHQENLRTILTHVIYNELSNVRNPNNMTLLAVLFQHAPEDAAKMLGEIFLDFLCNRDDYLRALRALLREIVRSLKYEVNFSLLARSLMEERLDSKFISLDPPTKERVMVSIADIVTLIGLLSISPQVREAVAAFDRGEFKELEVLTQFQLQMSAIQRDSVWWLHSVVPKMFDISKVQDYVHCLHKVLFLEKAEHYHNKDNWPPENDRSLLLRVAAEVPVNQDMLMRVLVIGLSRDLPLNSADTIELADQLIRRAAALQFDDFPALKVDRLEMIDVLLNLCTYHHPENITLPDGYKPPTLAISNLYWKAWSILALIAAFNPKTFGRTAWDNYPTLKCCMEMMMTNNYRFPPPTTASDEAVVEEIRSRDRQLAQMEKHEILEFEGHLAAATRKVTITEINSLLLDQLTRMDPRGAARKPPAIVVEQLKALNKSLRIGHMLCSSRTPDFLMDIVQRQGTSQSMPWLAELVEASDSSLDILPVQCLCEFLLHDAPDAAGVEDDDDESYSEAQKYKKKQKQKKQEQLLKRLQRVLWNRRSNVTMNTEILDYFLRRLSNQQAQSRALAIKGLSMVLCRLDDVEVPDDSGSDTDMETDDKAAALAAASRAAVANLPALSAYKWLLRDLPKLPRFQACRPKVLEALRSACQIETNVLAISSYLIFLSEYGKFDQLQEVADVVLDISQLIVERSSVMCAVIPLSCADWDQRVRLVLAALIKLYNKYLTWAKAPDDEAFSWSDCQDQILLKWESGGSATLHILVVHAMIIILSYGQPRENDAEYMSLLSAWFPRTPSAYLVDTSEEALLLPDWLKLKMIRSYVEPLVDAGLRDLEPPQLILFVQSFGIPVMSMTKLLHCLDHVVTQTPGLLEQVLVDKNYMAQLVEVQHARGATGGHKFYSVLVESTTPETDVDDDSNNGSKVKHGASSKPAAINLLFSQDETSTKYRRPGHITAALKRIFLDELLNQSDREQMYKSLQKAVMKSGKLGVAAVECLEQMFSSRDADNYISAMYKYSRFSCPLLRILAARQSKSTSGRVETLMAWILDRASDQSSPLTKMARQHFSASSTTVSAKAARARTTPLQLRSGDRLDESKFIEAVRQAEKADYGRLEELVNVCMRDSLNDVTNMATTSCRLLENSSDKKVSQTSGLIIDWLELLEPEVIAACPELEERLLFAKRTTEVAAETDKPLPVTKSSGQTSSAYLLALLTHRTSWKTLHRCINKLLRPNVLDRGYNYASVLDFLWACLHIPKIWQGRDKKLPLNYVQEDVLNLSLEQMTSVVDCVVAEAAEIGPDTVRQPGTADGHYGSPGDQQRPALTADTPLQCVERRLYLLKKCCCDRKDRITAVMEHLYRKIKCGSQTSVCHHLVLELYLHYPYSIYWLDDWSSLLVDIQAAQHTSHQYTTSKVDAITHRLMLSLSETGHGSRVENMICDANIALRKFAMEHPTLLLRQIPMLAALLRGRSHFTAGEFKHRNNHILFTYSLGIVELLVPQIFHKQHAAVVDIIDQYFLVIKSYAFENNNFMAAIVPRFLRMLNNYLSQDSQRAVRTLKKHQDLLVELTRQMPDFATLKALIACVSRPRQENESSSAADDSGGGATSAMMARPSSPYSMVQLAPFLKKISQGSCEEDVLEVLQDLDNTSKRKAEILEHFLADLKRLMYDHNDSQRNLAFVLVMRHVRQNPRACGQFVPSFIKCLESENYEIINSALRNLAEFTLLGQEHASRILQKAFSACISTKMDMTSHINEAVQLLNMETMQ